jgi:hypothetical protein
VQNDDPDGYLIDRQGPVLRDDPEPYDHERPPEISHDPAVPDDPAAIRAWADQADNGPMPSDPYLPADTVTDAPPWDTSREVGGVVPPEQTEPRPWDASESTTPSRDGDAPIPSTAVAVTPGTPDTTVQAADPINAALAAIDPTKVYTPTDIEMQLVDIERRLEQGQVFQRVWENHLYDAAVAFELAWARAIDRSDAPSADRRKAAAILACEEQLVAKMTAEHMVKAIRETMHNLRAMLSGYQSIASSIRSSMSVAGVGRT